MKSVECYGVKMNSLQEIMLMKYINNNNISMNTKTAEERRQIVVDFLVVQENK